MKQIWLRKEREGDKEVIKYYEEHVPGFSDHFVEIGELIKLTWALQRTRRALELAKVHLYQLLTGSGGNTREDARRTIEEMSKELDK